MDNNMIMDFLMKAQESAAKQQEIAAQQNLAFQQNQNSMMQLLAAIMTQPQPDPTQQMPTPPNMQQTMALSNAAATPNLAEVNDLKAQIDALKQQLADAQAKMSDMQGQLTAANERASAAEAQAAQIQAQYDQLARDVSIVEVSQGRPLQEIVEESQLMTGDDYYDRNREEYQNMDGQEAHRLIQDKMDAKDEWIKQHSTEEEYKDFRAKLHQREEEQYNEQNGIVNFSKGMVDMSKTVKKRPETDKDKNF